MSVKPNPCQCIDCGGDQPTHSSDCTYMLELYGDPVPELTEIEVEQALDHFLHLEM